MTNILNRKLLLNSLLACSLSLLANNDSNPNLDIVKDNFVEQSLLIKSPLSSFNSDELAEWKIYAHEIAIITQEMLNQFKIILKNNKALIEDYKNKTNEEYFSNITLKILPGNDTQDVSRYSQTCCKSLRRMKSFKEMEQYKKIDAEIQKIISNTLTSLADTAKNHLQLIQVPGSNSKISLNVLERQPIISILVKADPATVD